MAVHHRAWEQAIIEGESLREIAERYGVSRQAIEQATPKWLRGLVRQRDAARRRMAAIVDDDRWLCTTCFERFARPGRVHCSLECREIALRLRAHMPESTQQMNSARTILRRHARGEPYAESTIAHARQVVANGGLPKNRVFLVRGSKAEEAALLTYRAGWPIFERLPEAVQQRVAALDATPTQKVYAHQ